MYDTVRNKIHSNFALRASYILQELLNIFSFSSNKTQMNKSLNNFWIQQDIIRYHCYDYEKAYFSRRIIQARKKVDEYRFDRGPP
jgi:hypothetical protein